MSKIGELELVLPIQKFEAYPSYFIGAGGMGYLIISWLMHYLSHYLPSGQGMDQFTGAQFLVVDTAAPDNDRDLPPKQWAASSLVQMTGNLEDIITGTDKGFFPGVKDFYRETTVSRLAREEIKNNLIFGAATTRPFGRIGFFYNWDQIFQQFRRMVQTPLKSQSMRFGGDFNILTPSRGGVVRRFFIVSSLAGGTGSSCFLDIAATLRHLQETNFQDESWIITGIFTLADVLSVDAKIDKELKKTKMKANAYAALKELNHFFDGHPFTASYGRDGQTVVKFPDPAKDKRVTLFDQVFLVDTPNRDQRPLSGRKEVAQFLAQALLLFGTTSIGQGFFNRLVDTSAILAFRKNYPATNPVGVVKEKQHFLFSTMGLSTLTLPLLTLLDYANYRLAAELLEHLFNLAPLSDPLQTAGQLAISVGLTEEVLDQAFNQCFIPALENQENCFQRVREAANPMQMLRQWANTLAGLPMNDFKASANRTGQTLLQTIFPAGGQGPVEKALNELVGKGQLPAVNAILNNLVDRLKSYYDRLTNEGENAAIQSNNQEGPAEILQNTTFAGLTNAMENSWRNWGATVGRGMYRNWFIARYEGGIRSIINMLLRAQDLARTASILDAKLQLVEQLMERLSSLNNHYKQQQDHHQDILTELSNAYTQKEIELSIISTSRFRETALAPKVYYQKIFLSGLPGAKDELIGRMVTDLQINGLPFQGSNQKQDLWRNFNASELAEALAQYCRKSIFRIPGNLDQDLDQADPLYREGLDNRLFMPGAAPSPFNLILENWAAKAQVSLLFKDPPETSGYVISGARTEGNFTWQDVLNMTGLTPVEGGPPTQAALLTFALGFPLSHLSRIQDWYKEAYLPQKREGWPLHLFKEEGLEVMMEPFLDWTGLPGQQEAEELTQLAEELGIVSFTAKILATGANEELLSIESRDKLLALPDRIRDFFFRTQPQAKDFEWDMLVKIFRENEDLLEDLKHGIRSKQSLGEEDVSVEDLLQTAQSAELLQSLTTRQFGFHLDLYRLFVGARDDFCEAFFEKARPVQIKITRSKFIQGLSRHEPLCRWITKRILRSLLHEARVDQTMERFRDGKYPAYLMELLRNHHPEAVAVR